MNDNSYTLHLYPNLSGGWILCFNLTIDNIGDEEDNFLIDYMHPKDGILVRDGTIRTRSAVKLVDLRPI